MPSRRLHSLGLAVGMLAPACTPTGPASDLELPEDDWVEVVELPIEPREPETAPPLTPDDIDFGDALPSAPCEQQTAPREAVEVDDPEDPGAGRLLTELEDGRVVALPLEHTRFETSVVGTVAETVVTQRFGNPLPEPVEVVYTFPLPHDGAVDDYWLQIGKRRIEAKLLRRERATQVYEDAKKAGHSAGLLEQERPNVFTQHVANVPPGATIEVGVHLVQPLRPEGGRYELVLPTVVGPRFIPGNPTGSRSGTGMLPDTDRVGDASRITPPIVPPGFRTCGDLEIAVDIDTGGPITALSTTSHRIGVETDELGATVRLDERYALLNRDFVLSWRRDSAEPRATLQAQPDADGDGGYFTLSIHPPLEVDPSEIPGREIVFVVDASGSMSGEPMSVAKDTMRRFIGGLGPDDAFSVIRFSESASGLSEELVPVTTENVKRALEYVDALTGQGGTQMTEGIRAALGLPRRSDRLRYVVFLTDGYIGHEREVFDLIAEHIGDARLFSLGVGSSVNRYLLDGMARMGRGSAAYIDLTEPSEPLVQRLYDKLRQPALVDLSVDVEDLGVKDLVPGVIPDLFVGEPIVLFGRYDGRLQGTVTLRGRRGEKEIEVPVALRAARDEDVDGVRSMWARHRIDELVLDPSLVWASQPRRDAVTQQIIELSLEQRVLTEHTAFVAVDRTRTIDGKHRGTTLVQAVDNPSGVAYEAVWGHVGSPSGSHTLSGIGSGGGGSGSGYGRGTGAGFGGRGSRMPRIRQARATVKGSLDRVIIRRIVRSHINEVRHCYNQGLIRDPSLSGRVVIRFVIDSIGNVSTAVVSESELPDPKVGTCIARTVKRWSFPKSPGGGQVLVNYPFVLSPG